MQLIRPLCHGIESDLRIHVHTVLLEQMETPNPKQARTRSLVHLLHVPPIRIIKARAVCCTAAAALRV